MISAWVGVQKNWPGDKLFKLRKSKFWERQFFWIVTFELLFDIPLLINLFIPLIELKNIHSKHEIKENSCKFKIDKSTYSKHKSRAMYDVSNLSLDSPLEIYCIQ